MRSEWPTGRCAFVLRNGGLGDLFGLEIGDDLFQLDQFIRLYCKELQSERLALHPSHLSLVDTDGPI
jgi:hypothetical protein